MNKHLDISKRTFPLLKEHIIDYAFAFYALYTVLLLTISILRAFARNEYVSLFSFSVVLLLIAGVLKNSRKIALKTKNILLSLVSGIVLCTGLYLYGITASASLYILAVPAFQSYITTLAFGLKSFVFHCLLYVAFVGLYSYSILETNMDLWTNQVYWHLWTVDSVSVAFCISIFFLARDGFSFNSPVTLYQIIKQNKKLLSSERKYRLLFEASNDAIVLIKDHTYFDCNKKTLDLFQCEISSIIGHNIKDLSPEAQPDEVLSETKIAFLIERVLNGEPQIFEWRHLRADGTEFDACINLSHIQLEEERYLQAVLRDITMQKRQKNEIRKYRDQLEQLVEERTQELAETNYALTATNEELLTTNEELYLANAHIQKQHKQLESKIELLKQAQSQLIQSEKMASLGILTSGISHEINNPLNFIMGAHFGLENYFVETNQNTNPQLITLMNSLEIGLERATEIIASLNQFSSEGTGRTELCNIPEIIDNCLIMLKNRSLSTIKIQTEYPDETTIIDGNIGDMHQLFMNIITNSYQSINKSGTIGIDVSKNTDTIEITISDSGKGMDDEALRHIFDPFYTTKEPGEGTGLGLSIAYNIVGEHNGKITYTSTIGKGTLARVVLPILALS